MLHSELLRLMAMDQKILFNRRDQSILLFDLSTSAYVTGLGVNTILNSGMMQDFDFCNLLTIIGTLYFLISTITALSNVRTMISIRSEYGDFTSPLELSVEEVFGNLCSRVFRATVALLSIAYFVLLFIILFVSFSDWYPIVLCDGIEILFLEIISGYSIAFFLLTFIYGIYMICREICTRKPREAHNYEAINVIVPNETTHIYVNFNRTK